LPTAMANNTRPQAPHESGFARSQQTSKSLVFGCSAEWGKGGTRPVA
jgi:hypothetical protein